MQLISVNIAQPVEVSGTRRGAVRTAIFKRPVAGPVMIRTLNVDGDAQADLVAHGGVDKAVYAYALDDYAYWAAELGREAPGYGWFGENLTLDGVSSDTVLVGDVFSVGAAVLQVTQPRIPCFKLEHKMGIRNFPGRFRRSGRTGFYLRVLEEGSVQAGDQIRLTSRNRDSISIRDLSDSRHFRISSAEEIERIIAIDGLSARWRSFLRGRLQRMPSATKRS